MQAMLALYCSDWGVDMKDVQFNLACIQLHGIRHIKDHILMCYMAGRRFSKKDYEDLQAKAEAEESVICCCVQLNQCKI